MEQASGSDAIGPGPLILSQPLSKLDFLQL